jgi:fused signal recognition particle receptor
MFRFLKEKLKEWTEKISAPKERPEETREIAVIKKEPKEKKRKETVTEILEEIEEEEDNKELPKSFFEKVKEKTNKVKVTYKDFEDHKDELEISLLENNVAFEVVDRIISKLRTTLVGKEILRNELEGHIKDTFRDVISEILIPPFDLIDKVVLKDPCVILFFGINGSGKTTTIAKIAEMLKSKHISCVMAAADTFRAASIEQLKEHGKRIGVDVIAHEYGSDPASVGFDAINHAKKNKINCVLIDTAGRMHTEKNLIKEMEKISRVCKPDLKIFIGESITGNDATEQARTFNENIGIDGIILSKSDIDEKGGTALSVGFVTRKPILYLGTGQSYKDLEPFDKNKFFEKLGLK